MYNLLVNLKEKEVKVMNIKAIVCIVCSVALLLAFAGCGNNNEKDNATSSLPSNNTVSSQKTVSVASEEPVSSVEWPTVDALSSLPKLGDTVDYYLDDTMGAETGSYQIKLKELSYEDFKAYVNKLMDEHNFSSWDTVGEMYLPDELPENDTAFCPLTNGSDLWGIIEYKSSDKIDYVVNMFFYNYNPYSGY